ncbi:MAG: hypothetical protein HY299_09100 [Verrucomicrobia bacterium]|nr:hypothetical protein [Verrucomicrobiota bacterium]
MDGDKTITAKFTQNLLLRIDWDSEDPTWVDFLVRGELGAKYALETLAKTWTPLIHFTNSFGEMRIRQPINSSASYQWYRARKE